MKKPLSIYIHIYSEAFSLNIIEMIVINYKGFPDIDKWKAGLVQYNIVKLIKDRLTKAKNEPNKISWLLDWFNEKLSGATKSLKLVFIFIVNLVRI